MNKTFSEAINGIRYAVMASEVREDIAKGMEYVERFANTAITKAAEAADSAAAAAESAGNINATISGSIDPTLSVSGKAADAKVTGDAVQSVRSEISSEADRAKAAEEKNARFITSSSARAWDAEQALSKRIDALESCGFVVVDGKVCMKYVKS